MGLIKGSKNVNSMFGNKNYIHSMSKAKKAGTLSPVLAIIRPNYSCKNKQEKGRKWL